MKRERDDNKGLWLKDATVGQFESIEKDDYKEMFLYDNNRNAYPLHTVTVLSAQFSRSEGEIDFPKPFRVKPDGTIIETGAKVLIIFPMGKTNPVVLGCLNRLGSQNQNAPGLQLGIDNLRRKKKKTINDESAYGKVQDGEGIQQTLVDSSYSVDVVGGNIGMRSDTVSTLEGKQYTNLLGKTVEIGGNTERITDYPTDNIKNKADVINLYGKKIILGHSNTRGADIKVDKPDTIAKPVLQNSVMGITLKAILDAFVSEVINAKYTGSGIIKMIPTSQATLRVNVKRKLDKILSKVVFVMYDPEQVESQDGSIE